MERVKRFMDAGLSTSDAIKQALDVELVRIAEKYDLAAPILYDVVNAKRVAPERYIEALVNELGGTPDEWRHLLWEAAKPASPAA